MKTLLLVGIVILAIIPLSLLIDWPIWLVYNAVCFGAFHWPHLSYWQTVGLMFLITCLGGCFKATVSGKS